MKNNVFAVIVIFFLFYISRYRTYKVTPNTEGQLQSLRYLLSEDTSIEVIQCEIYTMCSLYQKPVWKKFCPHFEKFDYCHGQLLEIIQLLYCQGMPGSQLKKVEILYG